MEVSLWIQIPIIILSLAYGISLLVLLILVTARGLYLLDNVPKDGSKTSALREFCLPSQQEKHEEYQNSLAKPYGALFGFNVGAMILVAQLAPQWFNNAVDSFGLMGFFVLQTGLIGMMVAELVLLSVVIGGCLWGCSRHRAWGPR